MLLDLFMKSNGEHIIKHFLWLQEKLFRAIKKIINIVYRHFEINSMDGVSN